jgi:hypothetical protein
MKRIQENPASSYHDLTNYYWYLKNAGAKEIAKVECEGHALVKFLWPKPNVSPKQSPWLGLIERLTKNADPD